MVHCFSAFLSVVVAQICWKSSLLNGTDQQKAGEEHHRAGHAMNGERWGLSPARDQNVEHVAQRDDGEN